MQKLANSEKNVYINITDANLLNKKFFSFLDPKIIAHFSFPDNVSMSGWFIVFNINSLYHPCGLVVKFY